MSKETEDKDYRNADALNKFREELRKSDYMLKSVLELSEKLISTLDIKRLARIFAMSIAGNLGINRVSVFVASAGGGSLRSIYSLGTGSDFDLKSMNVSNVFIKWLREEKTPVHIDTIYTGKSSGLLVKGKWLEKIVKSGFGYLFPLQFDGNLKGLIFFSGKVDGKGFDKDDSELLKILMRIGSAAVKNALDFEALSKSSVKRNSFSEVKSELTSRRSFELNTPLTVLKSTLWSIESNAVSESLMLDMARDAAKHLESGINELANIAEIEFDGTGLQFRMTDISTIVEECLRKILPDIEEKGISVIFDEKVFREVRVDRARIKIAVEEIIGSAVKFMPSGGRLKIALSIYQTGPNEMEGIELRYYDSSDVDAMPSEKDISSKNETVGINGVLEKQLRDITAGEWLVLRVKNSGGGTEEEKVDKTVKLSPKRSNSSEKRVKRMGAGLFISQKIISEHDGKLYYRSTEDEGTEFSVWLPA
ncbi:MAG: HAMP domain-containing sensor histidine kinase [Candidatus Krumholzibacteriota bacterium]|nr:HAMP domain-containing sensor histidine kinase [Candidatus Krumholzibacteriota bacterium]